MSFHTPLASATTEMVKRIAIPRRSEFLYRWFSWWVRGYLAKHFHAVRLSRDSLPRIPADAPLVIVVNHPSWWDPLMGMVLADLFPKRSHYAPMDAQMLDRYPLFSKLGFYGVEQGPKGAAVFLRTTVALLSQPGTTVWITAQGRFADPRVRPPGLRSGIGHLVQRLSNGFVVPLALEYPFWEERLPEALARFGAPIALGARADLCPSQWVKQIEKALAATQDALAADALARDPAAFVTLLRGKAGVGGIYDCWRRVVAWLRGERFQPEHGSEGGMP
jgi:1-acyl-sn-glycerol-3-phosphate acyltransferase